MNAAEAFLRRYKPDQVQRVYLTPLLEVAGTPGGKNLKQLLKVTDFYLNFKEKNKVLAIVSFRMRASCPHFLGSLQGFQLSHTRRQQFQFYQGGN